MFFMISFWNKFYVFANSTFSEEDLADDCITWVLPIFSLYFSSCFAFWYFVNIFKKEIKEKYSFFMQWQSLMEPVP